MTSASRCLNVSAESIPSPEERRRVDPLGVIENLAKTLWREDESRRSERWEDYWAEAESWMVKGLGGTGESKHHHHHHLSASPLSPEFADLLGPSQPRILQVLARAVVHPLNDHEACSLGYILRTSAIIWIDGKKDAPLSSLKIGELLAQLSFDYTSEFLDSQIEDDLVRIPFGHKADYWAQRIKSLQEADQPLGYTDQNTILRLRTQICGQPEVDRLEFEG